MQPKGHNCTFSWVLQKEKDVLVVLLSYFLTILNIATFDVYLNPIFYSHI